MPQTKIPASRDCGSRSYNGFGVGAYACVCDESQICYHMTWQKMFNSCTCAKFRQILLDVSNKMFQVNIQCQTNAYNNFPHWLSLLCGILDAFSPYRFLSFAHTHTHIAPLPTPFTSFIVIQIRLTSAFDIYCTTIRLHSIIQRIHTQPPVHIIIVRI